MNAGDFLIHLLPPALLVGGLAFLGWAFLRWRTALASRRWPVVPGEVVQYEVDVRQLDTGSLYTPGLVYRYEVGGRRYEGTRIDFFSQRSFQSQSAADAVLAPYRRGALTVHFNPERPAESVLVPGVSAATWVVAALVVLLLATIAWLPLPA